MLDVFISFDIRLLSNPFFWHNNANIMAPCLFLASWHKHIKYDPVHEISNNLTF